jgi:NTE family protein
LVYRQKPYESGARDFEFSRQSMLDHWAAGVENVGRYLDQPGHMLETPLSGEVAVYDPGWNPAPGPA